MVPETEVLPTHEYFRCFKGFIFQKQEKRWGGGGEGETTTSLFPMSLSLRQDVPCKTILKTVSSSMLFASLCH